MENNTEKRMEMNKKKKETAAGLRIFCWYVLLCLLLVVLLWLNLDKGSVKFAGGELFRLLAGKGDPMHHRILFHIRLPRALAALLLGGALSVSGYLLQTFFANPIAGPFIMGISHSAKLAVAVVMVLFLNQGAVLDSASLIGAAFVGSMLSMGLILVISCKVRAMSVLIICGVMIGYICSAITDFLVTFADDANIVNLHNWSLGSFSGTTMEDVGSILIVVLTGLVICVLLSKPISAYQLGETQAKSLGVNIRLFQVIVVALSGILSATVTAFAGPISFVGVAVPHLIRSLLKTARPLFIIPGCFLGGGVFCLFCDLIARTLFAPAELSISSVTAVFGAPVVILVMLRREGKTD